jgi:hypothetical protein
VSRFAANSWCNFFAARHSMTLLSNEKLFPRDGLYTYPDHPFDPDLCEAISKFRSGLTDIALSGQLSHQVIRLISQLNTWDHDVSSSLRNSDVYNLHELSLSAQHATVACEFLHRPGLSIMEQLLVLGLIAFSYSTDISRGMFYLTNAFLQIRCKYMRSLHIEATERNEAFLTWVGTILVATFDPSAQPCLFGLSLLKARPTSRDWQANVKVSETYLWNDGLSLKLSARIRHFQSTERRGSG